MKRKLTADERDRKIVAKAGYWMVVNGYLVMPKKEQPTDKDETQCAKALVRIANRIVKEEKA